MITFKFANVMPIFQPGTTVKAYAEALVDGGAPRPLGTAVAEAIVAEDGSLTFTTLTEYSFTYFAAAKIGSVWRIVAFTTHDAPSGVASSAELEAHGLGVIVHGSDPSIARGTGFAQYVWIGSAEPENALEDDIWHQL